MAGVASLFGGGKVATPTPQPVVKMPDREDPALLNDAERKRRKAQEQAGGGRDQTILTSGAPVTYGSNELGK